MANLNGDSSKSKDRKKGEDYTYIISRLRIVVSTTGFHPVNSSSTLLGDAQ